MNDYIYFRVKKDGTGWISTIDHKTRTSLVTGTIYKTKNSVVALLGPSTNKNLMEILSNFDVLMLTNGNMDGLIELI
jgi:hypothetical protein